MSRQIHVLVALEQREAATANNQPHPVLKRRWEELNEVLDRNKKAKVNCALQSALTCHFRRHRESNESGSLRAIIEGHRKGQN